MGSTLQLVAEHGLPPDRLNTRYISASGMNTYSWEIVNLAKIYSLYFVNE